MNPGCGSRIRDGKKSGSGSGMNIPDHFSETLETVVGKKILKFFRCGSGIFFSLDTRWKNSDPK
jgi:hypothetical protein